MRINGSESLNWCTDSFCFVNTYKFCKALQVLASMSFFLFVLFLVSIKQELKIGCLVKVEVELMSMTHYVVNSKRSEKKL